MDANVVVFLILAVLVFGVCACGAWVAVNGKNGWGWFVALAFLIVCAVRIKVGG